MKIPYFTIILFLSLTQIFGQSENKNYLKGLKKAKSKKYEAAIKLFTKAIAEQPEDYLARFNRAIAKFDLNEYESGLSDLDTTIQIKSNYYPAILTRGIVRKNLTDYSGAISDFSRCIRLEPFRGEGFYYRGLVLQMLEKTDSACNDFKSAKGLGVKPAERKLEWCLDTTKTTKPHFLLRLTKTSDDNTYGFSQDNPIKVGKDEDGGPGNSYKYLQLLRDQKGKPVSYRRTGSCCMYDSENGMNGKALLDHYLISFFDESGKKKETSVFMTFYDFEEPKILKGFKTIGQP